MAVYTRVIKSGSLIEIYEYDKKPRPPELRKRQKKDRRKYRRHATRNSGNVYRARKNFLRLVRSNVGAGEPPALLTLTMHQILPLRTSSGIFTEFLQCLRRVEGNGIRVIAVPEFQERGAVHYHCLIWGMPQYYGCTTRKNQPHKYCKNAPQCESTSRRIQRLWLRGFVDARVTNGHAKLAGYLAKYMFKAMHDVRLGGEKAYHASRNVMRQMSVGSSAFSDEVKQELGLNEISFAVHKFKTRYLGECTYEARKI